MLAATAAVVTVAALVAVRLITDPEPPARSPAAGGATTTTPDATTTTGTDGVDTAAVFATAGGEVGPEALRGIHFTEVSEQAGLVVGSARRPELREKSMTSGVAVADVDVDGDTDLYVTRAAQPAVLYLNDGPGRFRVATDSGSEGPPDGLAAATFADLDGDGCTDLAGLGLGRGSTVMYMGRCDGTFVDEALARGFRLPEIDVPLGAQGHGLTAGDPDHDGDLDLLALHWDPGFLAGESGAAGYVAAGDPDTLCGFTRAIREAGRKRADGRPDRTPAAGPNRSRFFRNDGTGHFSDATAEWGLQLDGTAAFTADFVDVDGDGWEDLLVTGDFCTSAVYRNDAGSRFVDVTAGAGIGTDENAMGSVVRDVDGDGDPDWFVTSVFGPDGFDRCPKPNEYTGCSGNRLWRNRGDGTFEDVTDAAGVRIGWWGWGAAIEDFGDDGRLSVVMTNGYVTPDPPRSVYGEDPMILWVPGDDGSYQLASTAAGLTDDGVGHGLVAFDADGDGDLDVAASRAGAGPLLYRNDRPAGRHWLTVRLDDPTRPGNRAGLGARVRVTPASGRPVTGWISTGGSYETQRLPELHVGLGTTDAIRTVEVWWPGSTEPQIVESPKIDRVLTVRR